MENKEKNMNVLLRSIYSALSTQYWN